MSQIAHETASVCSFEPLNCAEALLTIMKIGGKTAKYSSNFQPLCHGILVCHKWSKCVPLEFVKGHIMGCDFSSQQYGVACQLSKWCDLTILTSSLA